MSQTARNGILFAFLSAIGYALLPIFTKYSYIYSDFSPIQIAGWRFSLAAPLVWALIHLRDRFTDSPHKHEKLPRVKLIILGFMLSTAALSVFYGLEHVETGLYVMLFRTYPAMVLVMSFFLGDHIPLRGWFALVLVIIGVGLLLFVPNEVSLRFSELHKLGIAAAFYNAFIVAVYNIGQQRVMAPFAAKLRAGAWTITGSMIVLFPLTLVQGIPPFPNWQTLAAILGLAVVSTILPVFAIYQALARIGAPRFVLVSSVEPLMALLWAWGLFGERLAVVQFIGAGLVISSLFVLELPPLLRAARRGEAAPVTGD